jgi:hypothetical protein
LAACLCSLLYAAIKLYFAVLGRAGFPGFPSSDDGTYDNIALRQTGLAAVAGAGALIALATVRPWGRHIPRLILLTATWIGFVMLIAGALSFLLAISIGPGPAGWLSLPVGIFLIAWAASGGGMTIACHRRPRR